VGGTSLKIIILCGQDLQSWFHYDERIGIIQF
jgi:hypothetical protein